MFAKKVKILAEHFNFSNVFQKEKALELLGVTNLNQQAIKLEEGK